MATIIIDGVRYMPEATIPELTDQRLKECLQHLTAIQYFSGETHKHRAWAWDAMNALSPQLAELAAKDPEAAFDRLRPED